MSLWTRRMICPLLGSALMLFVSTAVLAHEAATTSTVGTLKVERHGDHGRAVILIPGLQGGPWVWQQTIAQLQKNHVVYAVTLAGFDGVPAPADGGNLFMQKVGVIDPQLAARHAPMNARSDIKASAEYMAEDLAADLRPGLKNANVPILEIAPYNAPDFSQPPMVMSETQKVAYYQSLLADAPNAKVVSISPARHFVMLDHPAKFQQTLDDFLKSL